MDKCFTLHNEDGYVMHEPKNMLSNDYCTT